MPPVYAYIITGSFDESIKRAITLFTGRTGRFPAAVWLHPDRIPHDWPPEWPPVYPNAYLNRHIIGLELVPEGRDQSAQLRLI
jgi:hypothetical protein